MTREEGVPLAHYIEKHPGTGVLFTCLACKATRAVPMGRVLARLRASGQGDERTRIKTLGWRARQPCPSCGQVLWDAAPAWHAFPPADAGAGIPTKPR